MFGLYEGRYLKIWMSLEFSDKKANLNKKCLPSEKVKQAKTITCIGKHEPILVSVSTNLIDRPKNPQYLLIEIVATWNCWPKKIKRRSDS